VTLVETVPITPVTEVMAALADCVCTEVNAIAPTCWCGMTAGTDVAWDYCGECDGGHCGMAWVRLVGVTPYDIFPFPVIDPGCARPLAALIEVGALRCIPTLADGAPLDEATMAEVTALQMADMWALRRAVLCCGYRDLALNVYDPLGPQGGCIGGVWSVYFGSDG